MGLAPPIHMGVSTGQSAGEKEGTSSHPREEDDDPNGAWLARVCGNCIGPHTGVGRSKMHQYVHPDALQAGVPAGRMKKFKSLRSPKASGNGDWLVTTQMR